MALNSSSQGGMRLLSEPRVLRCNLRRKSTEIPTKHSTLRWAAWKSGMCRGRSCPGMDMWVPVADGDKKDRLEAGPGQNSKAPGCRDYIGVIYR